MAYTSSEGDFQGLELRPVEIKGGNLQDVKQAQVYRVTACFYRCHLKTVSSNSNVCKIKKKLFWAIDKDNCLLNKIYKPVVIV